MSEKIYLSPAYHRMNPCAISGCDETTHNNAYLDILQLYLWYNGMDTMRGTRRTPMSNEDGTALMKEAVADSNNWGADVHYISHTNAANGSVRGYRPIIFPGSKNAMRLAEILMRRRGEIYSEPISLSQRTDLYELKSTKATAYYEEHVFHDNYEDAKWFHDNMEAIAVQTTKGLCEYFGREYKDPHTYTANDALKALQISVGKKKADEVEMWRYDLDHDGKISATDALNVLKKAVGKV